jgi:hypothetical protein
MYERFLKSSQKVQCVRESHEREGKILLDLREIVLLTKITKQSRHEGSFLAEIDLAFVYYHSMSKIDVVVIMTHDTFISRLQSRSRTSFS